jgi:MoaA/NifB/PqqE/SkfB family radical SAM enzyme
MTVDRITNSNYEAYKNLDLVAFSYAFEGAMGDGGGICMIDVDGKVYYANYYYGNLQRDHIKDIIPVIEEIDFHLLGSESKNESWKHVNLGFGNNLFLKKDIFDDFEKRVKEADFQMAGELYQHWPGIVMAVIGKGNPRLTMNCI